MKLPFPWFFPGAVVVVVACTSTTSVQVTAKKTPEVVPVKPVENAETKAPDEVPRSEDPDAVYQMRQMHLSEWIEKVKRDCERTKNTDAWLPEREGFPLEEIELVKQRCVDGVEVGMRGDAWRKSMSACADRFAQTNGKGKHECRLTPKDVPDLPPELFERHKAACNESCVEAGEEKIELIKERAQFVRCCDGTTSPSCTYGSLHSGCCAGHHGICIPD